jgi:hypothetical protein
LADVNEIEIPVADGVTLIAWHAPAKEDEPTILYFHGNLFDHGAWERSTRRLSNSTIHRCEAGRCSSGLPVLVGSLLTASYEARPYGVGRKNART